MSEPVRPADPLTAFFEPVCIDQPGHLWLAAAVPDWRGTLERYAFDVVACHARGHECWARSHPPQAASRSAAVVPASSERLAARSRAAFAPDASTPNSHDLWAQAVRCARSGVLRWTSLAAEVVTTARARLPAVPQ